MFRGLNPFSKRKQIHDIVVSGSIDDLKKAIEEDNKKPARSRSIVNEITGGGKSTLSLLIQKHKSPLECMASSEDTFVKFGILLDYADHKNISIFLDALKDCPADKNSKINLILILLQKLTKGGEEMMTYISEKKEDIENQHKNFESGKRLRIDHSFDVDKYRTVKRDFDLAITIGEQIQNNIDPFKGIISSLDTVSAERFNIIYENINKFTKFIHQPDITRYIHNEKRQDDYETMYGGKRKQRKTKRNQKKKKRTARRY
jgi:hypothetical protein